MRINFKIDTGSDISIIPKKIFNKVKVNEKIQNLNAKIQAYGGFEIK